MVKFNKNYISPSGEPPFHYDGWTLSFEILLWSGRMFFAELRRTYCLMVRIGVARAA
jgi:hypothetical protein